MALLDQEPLVYDQAQTYANLNYAASLGDRHAEQLSQQVQSDTPLFHQQAEGFEMANVEAHGQ
jgi:hypothetical protein